MKISVDTLLSSAHNINNQRKTENELTGNRKNTPEADSVKLENRLASRLDTIQQELGAVQSSLSKNQALDRGFALLKEAINDGGAKNASIINETTFENKKILADYLGESFNQETIDQGHARTRKLIEHDIDRIKKIQIEVENITASELAGGDRLDKMLKNLQSILSGINASAINGISQLRTDSVMRLLSGNENRA